LVDIVYLNPSKLNFNTKVEKYKRPNDQEKLVLSNPSHPHKPISDKRQSHAIKLRLFRSINVSTNRAS